MNYLRNNILSLSALAFVFIFYLNAMLHQQERWQQLQSIRWDVEEYYMYLPAAFIHKDIGFSYAASLPDSLNHTAFGKSPTGKNVGRLSVGMAMAYTPFFLAGHFTAHLLHFPACGYSKPYQFFIFFSGLVYCIIGFIFLRKILLLYFSQLAAALTIVCIGLGTNLFYYSTTEGPMPHSVLFCLFSVFLYYTIQWYKQPGYKNIILLSAAAALAIIIRPLSIMLIIIFLLYKGNEKNAFRERIRFYTNNYKMLLAGIVVCILIALPQLLYWKIQTGQWIYYSYADQHFFFDDPRLLEGLLGYRKGWLVYTPIMILSLIGFGVMYKRVPKLFFPVLIYVILHIYIIFCWWCWWYGGSFGMRAMIEVYALLALPVGALWQVSWQKQKFLFSATLIFAFACMYLNSRQTLQYRATIIHWDSMNKAYYWAVFNKLDWPSDDTRKLLSPPDYKAALEGRRSQK